MPAIRSILSTLLVAALCLLQGCAFAVGAAAGGAAGYMLKEKGYTVQSPVTHEHR
ncbi:MULTISPECIES: hypothetical protein [Niveibacterium]|uniref:Lipoprotein n=1 Tax=Niveibacterium microcysteis TaxID=2811415 RepID=A0ABX7MD01_9RHOO|nr:MULTISPECIES: hypothetical protein [Niveibacterium]QSI77537.1 hypothetical protein JY500_02455 [Niveibacterium microcysteis]